MVEISDIKWGKYTQNNGHDTYEGPYYHGKWKYSLPENPSKEDKIVYAITATEGGTYDAVNMYDICIMTVGIIQWCDRFNLTSRMLGYVAEKGGVDLVMKHVRDMQLTEKLGKSIEFKQNKNKSWRWFLGGVECNIPAKLRELYFGGSSGKLGQWNDKQKDIAFRWAVVMARIWDSERARDLQIEYTSTRTSMFAMSDGRRILLKDNDSWEGWVGVTKAFYLAYAANNPLTANKKVKEADAKLNDIEKWSEEWCIKLLQILVLESGIRIWPGRYDRSRAAYEKLYGVVLPDNSQALQTWTPSAPESVVIKSDPEIDPIELTPIIIDIDTRPTYDDVDSDKSLPRDPPAPVIKYREEWNIFSFISWIFKLIFSVWQNTTIPTDKNKS